MPLTQEQIEAYLKDPWTCPFCKAGSDSIDAGHPDGDALDGTELMATKSCRVCGKTWWDYYKLHDVKEEDAEGQSISNEEG